MPMDWKRLIHHFDWGTRFDWVASLFGDWKGSLLTFVITGGGGGVMGYLANWEPVWVFFGVLVGGAAGLVAYAHWPVGQTTHQAALDLDKQYRLAIKRRNGLQGTVPNFNWKKENDNCTRWQRKVMPILERHGTAKEISDFVTLDNWDAETTVAEGKTAGQHQWEAIWDRKAQMLKLVIDRLGA